MRYPRGAFANEEPRRKQRGIKSESGQFTRRKRRGIGPQGIQGVDEILGQNETDFAQSGLKIDSVIRIARLAVVTDGILLGAIGEISAERLKRIKGKIAKWIQSEAQDSS